MYSKKFLTFAQAKKLAYSLKLKNKSEWDKLPYTKLQKHKIPRDPRAVYKDKWESWGVFLGTGNLKNSDKAKLFYSYSQCKKIIKKLKLESRAEFIAWRKTSINIRIPLAPAIAYKKRQWVSWPDFLSSNGFSPQKRSESFLTHAKAKAIVKKCKFQNKTEFLKWTRGEITTNSFNKKLPLFPTAQIPANPECAYKGKGFKNLRDFLGTKNLAFYQKQFMPFEKAFKLIRNINKAKCLIKSEKSFQDYCKESNKYKNFKQIPKGRFKGLMTKPQNIPDNPKQIYQDKWRTWLYFLIWVQPKLEPLNYLSYEKAKKFVHRLNLKGQIEWEQYVKKSKTTLKQFSKALVIKNGKFKGLPIKPVSIPAAVHDYYKNQKREKFSFGDFVGTGNIQNQQKKIIKK